MKASVVPTKTVSINSAVIVLAFKASKWHPHCSSKVNSQQASPHSHLTIMFQLHMYRDIYIDFDALRIMVSGIGDVYIIQIRNVVSCMINIIFPNANMKSLCIRILKFCLEDLLFSGVS